MPSVGVYCSAEGSSRRIRATSSSTTSAGKVSGCGKPPARDSTPGGVAARIAATSALRRRVRAANARDPPRPAAGTSADMRAELELAVLAAVELRQVLGEPGQVVVRGAAADRREHRLLGHRSVLGGIQGRG